MKKIKRLFSLALALALTLSLCACSGDGKEEVVIPGTYDAVGPFPGESYELNENGSYMYGEEKGTYTVDEEGGCITFQPKETKTTHTLTACGAYYHTDTALDKDVEYGLAPDFDENGRCNQTFETTISETPVTLELREDGSFSLSSSKEAYESTQLIDEMVYEGSYSLEDTVLSLDWGDATFPFLFADQAIYPVVYEKRTEETSAKIDATKAAVLHVEEEAAQNRWWTPADEVRATEITNALIGTWEQPDSFFGSEERLSFTAPNTVSVYEAPFGYVVVDVTGTFTVLKGAVMLDYKAPFLNGSGFYYNRDMIPYTYTDGILTLYEAKDPLNDEEIFDPAADLVALDPEPYYVKVNE